MHGKVKAAGEVVRVGEAAGAASESASSNNGSIAALGIAEHDFADFATGEASEKTHAATVLLCELNNRNAVHQV
jgi:hypothetical protein